MTGNNNWSTKRQILDVIAAQVWAEDPWKWMAVAGGLDPKSMATSHPVPWNDWGVPDQVEGQDEIRRAFDRKLAEVTP